MAQPVFNVTDFPTLSPLIPDSMGDAGNNTTRLNNMVQNLLSADGQTQGLGGILEFPQSEGPYYFDGGITVRHDDVMPSPNVVPSSIIFRGSPQRRDVPTLQQVTTSDTFFTINNNPGGADLQIGGVTFQDLIISFASTAGETDTGVGIYVDGGSSVRLHRVTLDECPGIALWLLDSLHSSMIDSNIRVENVHGSVGVRIGNSGGISYSKETYIAGTTILASKTNGTAFQIYGSEHLRVQNCRLEGWQYGLDMEVSAGSGNIENAYFGNVSILTSSYGVYMKASGGAEHTPSYITAVYFAECEIGPGGGLATGYDGAGIHIDEITDEAYTYIDQIRFVSCYSTLWTGAGLEIDSGTNIEVLGGFYSCNGNGATDASPVYASSGIAIVGGAEIRVSNVACNNLVLSTVNPPAQFVSATQDYGIYVGEAQAVKINGGSLTGNLQYGLWIDGTSGLPVGLYVKHSVLNNNVVGAVQVTGAVVSNVQIVDCPGYNDSQFTAIHTSLPSGSFTAAGYGYFGPVSFYLGINTGVTHVKINGIDTGVKSGAFYLEAGQTGEVDVSGGTSPTFSMVGQ